MIVYTIVSPLVGWLGDRYNRRVLLAVGRRALERGDGRHGVLAAASTRCSSGGPCSGVGEASYGVDRPGAAGRPVRAEGPRAG